MKNRFNSDTTALIQREKINKSARYDLEEWIFQQVDLYNNMQILDLGCGTGKQLFALCKLLSSESNIIGIDISSDAINRVNKRAETERIQSVKALECDFENIVNYFKDSSGFDLILSSYAIYYAKDMIKLISSFPFLLNQHGQVFICGYGKGTNQEIYDIINRFITTNSLKLEPTDDFIKEEDILKVANHFSSYRIRRLSNQVNFKSLENILTWWKNHNSFVPEVYQEVSKSLEENFQNDGYFSLTKNVLGIRYDV